MSFKLYKIKTSETQVTLSSFENVYKTIRENRGVFNKLEISGENIASYSCSILPEITTLVLNGVTIQRYGLNSLPAVQNIILKSTCDLKSYAVFYAPKLTKIEFDSNASASSLQKYCINSGRRTLTNITIYNTQGSIDINTFSIVNPANGTVYLKGMNRTQAITWYNKTFGSEHNRDNISSDWWVVYNSDSSFSGDYFYPAYKPLSETVSGDIVNKGILQYPSWADLTQYYNINTGKKYPFIPNLIYRSVRKASFMPAIYERFTISFNEGINGDPGKDFKPSSGTNPVSDDYMSDAYGMISDIISSYNPYKTFTIKIKSNVDVYDPLGEIIVPILVVLKQQKDFVSAPQLDEQNNTVIYSVNLSYTETGVTQLQKVLQECENTIKKFNANIYSINTHINIKEVRDATNNIFYKQYITDNILSGHIFIFRNKTTRKLILYPDDFNYYAINEDGYYDEEQKKYTEKPWTYRAYKWPYYLWDNGKIELDMSTNYDPGCTYNDANQDSILDGYEISAEYGQCMFLDEEPVEVKRVDSVDIWNYPIIKTKQRAYVYAKNKYYFVSDKFKNNTICFSYHYDKEKNTITPIYEIMYQNGELYEVRYLYKYYNDNPELVEPQNGYIINKELTLIYPSLSKGDLSEQTGFIVYNMSDGTIGYSQFEFSMMEYYQFTMYTTVKMVKGYYKAFYIINYYETVSISDVEQPTLLTSKYILSDTRVDKVYENIYNNENYVYIDYTKNNLVLYNVYPYYSLTEKKNRTTNTITTTSGDTVKDLRKAETYTQFQEANLLYTTVARNIYNSKPYFSLGSYSGAKLLTTDKMFPDINYLYVIDFSFKITSFSSILLGSSTYSTRAAAIWLYHISDEPYATLYYKGENDATTNIYRIPNLYKNTSSSFQIYYRLVIGLYGAYLYHKTLNEQKYTADSFTDYSTYSKRPYEKGANKQTDMYIMNRVNSIAYHRIQVFSNVPEDLQTEQCIKYYRNDDVNIHTKFNANKIRDWKPYTVTAENPDETTVTKSVFFDEVSHEYMYSYAFETI